MSVTGAGAINWIQSTYGVNMSERDVAAAVKSADKDGDGVISRSEQDSFQRSVEQTISENQSYTDQANSPVATSTTASLPDVKDVDMTAPDTVNTPENGTTTDPTTTGTSPQTAATEGEVAGEQQIPADSIGTVGGVIGSNKSSDELKSEKAVKESDLQTAQKDKRVAEEELWAANDVYGKSTDVYISELSILDRHYTALSEIEQNLKDQIELRNSNVDEQHTVQCQIDDLNASLDEQNTALDDLNTQKSDAESNISNIQASISGLGDCPPATITETSINSEGEEVSVTKDNPAYATWQSQKAALDSELAEAEALLQELEASIAEQEAQIEELEQQKTDAETELQTLKDVAEELDANMEQILKDAEMTGQEITDQLINVQNALTEKANAQNDFQSAKNNVNDANHEIACIHKDISSYDNAINEAKAREAQEARQQRESQ